MDRQLIVLALIFLAVGGGLTSAHSAPTPEPSNLPVDKAETSTPSPVEATTNATPSEPPKANEGDLSPSQIEGPSASPNNDLSPSQTESPSVFPNNNLSPSQAERLSASPNNNLSPSPTEHPSASPNNDLSAPPTEGPVAASPSGLDEEGYPIDPAPTPEIEAPPPAVSTPPPALSPSTTAAGLSADGPFNAAASFKVSYVIFLAGAFGLFSL